MSNTKTAERISKQEFVLRAIKKLRGKYRGIHVVYSGFNQAFRAYYAEDPRETVDAMVKAGLIDTKPAKGGIMIYEHDPNYVPDRVQATVDNILA